MFLNRRKETLYNNKVTDKYVLLPPAWRILSTFQKKIRINSEILWHIPNLITLGISKDGGKKRKVTSRSSELWSKPTNIDLISPILNKLLNTCISHQWLERSLYLLKAQSCKNNKIFLDSFDKIQIFTPNLSDLNEEVILDDNTREDKILLNHILPWLPAKNDEKFKEIRDNNPETLFIIPRFHFSYMNPGSYILPHLDNSTKLLSMMLYLPNKEQRGDEGSLRYFIKEVRLCSRLSQV